MINQKNTRDRTTAIPGGEDVIAKVIRARDGSPIGVERPAEIPADYRGEALYKVNISGVLAPVRVWPAPNNLFKKSQSVKVTPGGLLTGARRLDFIDAVKEARLLQAEELLSNGRVDEFTKGPFFEKVSKAVRNTAKWLERKSEEHGIEPLELTDLVRVANSFKTNMTTVVRLSSLPEVESSERRVESIAEIVEAYRMLKEAGAVYASESDNAELMPVVQHGVSYGQIEKLLQMSDVTPVSSSIVSASESIHRAFQGATLHSSVREALEVAENLGLSSVERLIEAAAIGSDTEEVREDAERPYKPLREDEGVLDLNDGASFPKAIRGPAYVLKGLKEESRNL